MKTETLPTIETSASPPANIGANPSASRPLPLVHLKNILVPLDFSPMSLKSLQYAIPFAQFFGARLTLLYVIEPLTYVPELPYGIPLPPDPTAEMDSELQRIRQTMIPAEIGVDTVVCEDFASEGVIDVAREVNADLIITTTHGRTGLSHLLMGSTAEKIVRKAPCPVLVLSERERDFF